MSVFNQPDRGSKDRTKRGLSSMEYKSASNHVLLNCPEVQPFLNDFVSQFGHGAVYSTFEAWFKECMAGRGRSRSRKDKRPIDHDDGATPTLPSTPHLHPSAADGRKQSSRHKSIPPHLSTHHTTHHSPAQQYYHHSPPQGYTPLPPHDPTSTNMGVSSHQSQSYMVRPSSAPFALSPAGSHPSRFQPAGSQQWSGSQQGSRSMQGCGLQPSSSRTPSPSPRSSSPSISRLRLRDSSTEPDAPPSAHTSDSSEDDDPDDVRYDRYHRIIIRPEGNGFIPNHQVTKIITDILGGLYNAPYPTWSDFPEDLVQQMFNQFKTKCAWKDWYNREICKNWEYKCRKRLSDSFSSARKVKKKPSWVLPDVWVDLQRYWATKKFEKQSELGKKARASEKGGSLHCLGSRSMGDTRRQMVIP
ncbi:uncharacterized protein [Nicotiana tomentosiformis]|uniref:uncharacterized protein n=1 Tax=Nicotiana tomentosiformis TaxID=4098 RepID=UPI00388CABFF